jgi:hypothetical protein
MLTIQELRARRANGEDITDELLNQLEELTARLERVIDAFNENVGTLQSHDHRLPDSWATTHELNYFAYPLQRVD